MKRLILLLLNCCLLQLAYAQNYQSIEEIDTACTQLGFMGDEEAEDAVDNILSQIGLFRNFTIQECPDINNAVAKNIDVGDGKKARYILYDNDFFEKISDKASNDWASTSILAHEIGHHLNGHSLNNEGSNHEWELEADEFSGFVLARMGSSLEDAQSAINTLKREEATRTHPAKADRLKAIETGWMRGSGKTILVSDVKKEENKTEEPKIEEKIEEENEITDVKVVLPIIDDSTDDKKLIAQRILSNHILAIGGEEKVIQMKSLYNKIKMTTKGNYNGTESNSEFNMELTYMSPNKYFSEMKMSGKTYRNLHLEGVIYTKASENDHWEFQSRNELLKNQASYVYEYTLLVNNEDVTYVGDEEFNGAACHVVSLPDFNSNQDHELFSLEMKIKRTNYYNIETGLLVGTKTLSQTITDYKNNNEYLIDSDVEAETISIYSNYKDYGGVLIAGKHTTITVGENMQSEMVMEYLEIEVNPEINPMDYKVKN